ncbi:MAG: UDP-N-acetylglucosamine 2-epimerase, partial [Clostridia bacterium]|nr:UDP-N-acetylglucosamine 2-epimerase [Clostridia bacterium]
EALRGMFRALRRIVEETPDVLVMFPVHHNPEVRRAAIDLLKGVPRIRMIEPPEIVSFHQLLSRAYLIMTDSGGIQEEAAALGIPTVVMRYSSERTEGLRTGTLKLAGTSEEGIYQLTKRLLDTDAEDYSALRKPSSVYGRGNASARIADILERCCVS